MSAIDAAMMSTVMSPSIRSSGQGLQLRQRHAIPRLRIVGRVARLDERVLRVDDFERRRFAGLIAQDGQAQAFGGEVRDVLQVVDRRTAPSAPRCTSR